MVSLYQSTYLDYYVAYIVTGINVSCVIPIKRDTLDMLTESIEHRLSRAEEGY